ncbi:BspA family leucine-rich repeat surface protein [Winogradskyella sp.]|uniref:BspA family leucine-rich repeat surface protein n=1 Tax=Winogradskyella sp. TaxID=1883156 RepID=UPI003BAAB642
MTVKSPVFLLIGLLFFVQSYAQTCGTPDNIIQNITDGSNVEGDQFAFYQSFVPDCDGILDSFTVWRKNFIEREANIFIAQGADPNSSTILSNFSFTLAATEISFPAVHEETTVPIPDTINLLAGETYAFVIVVPDGAIINFNLSSLDSYPDGEVFWVDTGSTTWEEASTAGGITGLIDFRFRINWRDQGPYVMCRENRSFALGASGTVNITFGQMTAGSGTSDGESLIFQTVNPNFFTCDDIGPQTVTLRVEDSSGQSAACSTTIEIIDNRAPELTCPEDISMTLNPGDPLPIVRYEPPAYSDCSIVPPDGFTYLGARDDKFYYVSDSYERCDLAFAQAEALGGRVATIIDEELNTLIRTGVDAIFGDESVLIGYNDVDTEGAFVWHDGNTTITYENWFASQPNQSGNRDYALLSSNGDGGWISTFAVTRRPYILQLTGPTTIPTTGLPSGSEFPLGTTTITYNVSDLSGNTSSCSFDVIIDRIPAETSVVLVDGKLIITDIENDSDDQITFSSDGTTLTISNLVLPNVSGGPTLFDTTTVTVPITAITAGIEFNAGNGDNTVTFANDLSLTGTTNSIVLNDINSYSQTGGIAIEGDLTINGITGGDVTLFSLNARNLLITGVDRIRDNDSSVMNISGTTTLQAIEDIVFDAAIFDNDVQLAGLVTIEAPGVIFAATGNLTFGTVTTTGTDSDILNFLTATQGNISLTGPVQTGGDSNIMLRVLQGDLIEQSASGTITTNRLSLEGNPSGTTDIILNLANNNVAALEAKNSSRPVATLNYEDINTIELQEIIVDELVLTANTITLSENTIFNKNGSGISEFNGNVTITTTDVANPAVITHNAGTLNFNGTTHHLDGALEYNASIGVTTNFNGTTTLSTTGITSTFGVLNSSGTFIVDSFTSILNEGRFSGASTVLKGRGSLSGAPTIVENDATLTPGGIGDVASLSLNDLAISSATFAPVIENDDDYDFLQVQGAVTLTNATLEPITGTETFGSLPMVLINNDGTDAVVGTFNGYPEGSTITFGNFEGVISYIGGDGNDVVLTLVETTVDFSGGKLTITDTNGAISDDQISLSSDGTTLTISNLIAPVQVIGGPTLVDATTVTLPLINLVSGIEFNAGNGDNTVTFANDLTLTGTTNSITLNDIRSHSQSGIIDIEGDFTINGNTGGTVSLFSLNARNLSITGVDRISDAGSTVMNISGTTTLQTHFSINLNSAVFNNNVQFAGLVNIEASGIIFIATGDLTLGTVTTTGTDNSILNSLSSYQGNISLTGPVQTAGDSDLRLRALQGDLIEQTASGTITTNRLTFEGNLLGTTNVELNLANNDVASLEVKNSSRPIATLNYTDSNTVELQEIIVDELLLTASDIALSENTILAKNGSGISHLNGNVSITAIDVANPAVINHNAGTINFNGTINDFDGALDYNGSSTVTTNFSGTTTLNTSITPNFGTINGTGTFIVDSFTSILNEGRFSGVSTVLKGRGSLSGAPTIVENDATLTPGGIGNVATLALNDLSITSATFAPVIENSNTYDALTVFGTVTLDNANLAPLGGYTAQRGDEVIIIDNDGDDAVIGTFNNLPEEAEVTFGDFDGIISYTGGDGNDVVLKYNYFKDAFITTWKTDNSGSSADDQITIFTDNSLTYDFAIDWGDGTFQTDVTGNITHTYDTAGTYTIRIRGLFPKFISSGDAEKLISIDEWGANIWSSFDSAFSDCENMDLLAMDVPDLSNVTTLFGMFDNCRSLVGNPSINNWDVSTIENMQLLFVSATNFNQPLDNWNVSNVTTMSSMFNGAESFNQDLNSWNTSQVQFMDFMFLDALDFNGAIGNWNVGNVVDMSYMFNRAEDFNQDLNSWNVSQVQEMDFMFLEATNFNGNISSWNPAQVITMNAMFQNAVNFNQDISGWNVSQVITMAYMFNGATNFNQPIGNWDVSNVQTADDMLIGTAFSSGNYDNLLIRWNQLTLQDHVNFGTDAVLCLGEPSKQSIITNHNWSFTDGGVDCGAAFITKWQTDNVGTSAANEITIATATSLGTTYDYSVDWGDGTFTYNLTGDATHTYTNAGLYTVKINGDFPHMYFNNGGDRLKLVEIEQWGDIAWSSMDRAFQGCQNLVISATDAPDLSNVTDMERMLQDAGTNIDMDLWADISNWDVSHVEDMSSLFRDSNFNQNISTWIVDNVLDMKRMFQSNTAFNQNIASWNVGQVTNMFSMFLSANSFDQDISSWDVSQVQNMRDMFRNATNFDRNLGAWDISGLQSPTMQGMLFNTALSAENYDNTLIGWATLEAGETQIPINVNLNAGNSRYCESEFKRQELISNFGWTIADAGKVSDCVNPNSFITLWETTSANQRISLGTGTNYSVNWGDGTIEVGLSGDAIHDYISPGTYTVSIVGDFGTISMNPELSDVSALQEVQQWGSIRWNSLAGAFYQCSNLEVTASDVPDLSNITDLNGMFLQCTSLVGNDTFNQWDVSNIESMEFMFWEATSFNQSLDQWEVGNVTSMREMFVGATSFDQDLGSWDISSLTGAKYMFLNAGLAIENYDDTLIGWATLDTANGETQIPTGINFDGGDSQYCVSEAKRSELINTYGWTIADAGRALLCFESNSFVTVWETTSDNESITIPTTGSGYNYAIDWGDGTVDIGVTGDATHEYATAGTYTIYISGDFPRVYFNDQGDRAKIKEVQQWGAIAWTSMENAFLGCLNLEVTASDAPDLSNASSLRQMFRRCEHMVGNASFDTWDVSTITNMESLFENARHFNQPLNNWNVSNVNNMSAMFDRAAAFNQPLNNWDVSNVSNMIFMFSFAGDFDQDIGNWDISSVTDMYDIFSGAQLSISNYDKLLIGWSTLDTGETQVPLNINFNGGSSQYCLGQSAREALTASTGFNWTMSDGGINCTDAFITEWDITSANQNISIGIGTNYNVDWGDGTIEVGLSGAAIHEYISPGTYTVSIIGDFGTIFISPEVFDVSALQEVQQWGSITWDSLTGAFFQCSNLDVTASDVPDLSNITDLNGMFLQCTSLIGNDTFNQWDVSNIESMEFMFWEATSFNQPLDEWNVGNVTSMQEMFGGAISFDQDLGTWDISSLTDAKDMFFDAGLSTDNYDTTLIGWATLNTAAGETQIPSNITFNGGNSQFCLSEDERQELIDTYGWGITDGGEATLCFDFNSFVTLWETTSDNESITIPTTGSGYNYSINWGDGTIETDLTGDATHVYDVAGEYAVKIIGDFPRIYFNFGGDRLKIKEVQQWGTMEWTSMDYAFTGCKHLDITATDLPDLSQVTIADGMLALCESLVGNTSFNAWEVSNIETMEGMFFGTTNFNQDLNNWNVSAVENMAFMFASATNFNQDISSWNVSSVTTMRSMFFQASNFNQNINNWNVSSVQNMSEMFSEMSNYNQPLDAWNVSSVTDMEDMFSDATNFNQPLNTWNVANVEKMNKMFLRAENFNQPLDNWIVSSVENMELMFSLATSFNQDLSNWDVSNTASMQRMFAHATNFDQDLGAWDISSLTGFNTMFTNAGVSTTNYDATLIGWATLDTGETQIPTGITFNGGSSQYCLSEDKRQELIDSYGWSITDGGLDPSCPTDILVAPKVYLQGASLNANLGEESLMRDDLRVNGLFPLNTPYSDGLTIDASVLTATGSDAIVDWVWVRLIPSGSAVLPGLIVGSTRSALLQRDGDVVDIDGISPLAFSISEGNYFVVVEHRNHLDIRSANAVSLTSTVTEVDLSSEPSMVEGGANSVLLLSNGNYGMYTGDFDGNAQIQNTDANAVIQLIGGAGYEDADMDINTQIQNTDVNVLISPNIGRGEQFSSRPGVTSEMLSTDVTLAFANAQITNDGMDDYYEADIMISGTTDFYLGSGQVYLEYNTAAFGENVATNNSIVYSQPDTTILGYSFGTFSPAYKDFIQNDNTTSRVSLSFQQNIALAGLETAPELEVTSTPKVLFHIKIRYMDVSQDAGACFYNDGVFQDQFFTACGGTATADCTNTPGVQITNDSYDCSEAGVDTLGISSLETDQILLYPNPTSSSFSIKGLTTTSQIRIYDVNGRLILEEQCSDDRPIDMSHYDNGVYLVEISTERGTQIKRLIKK